MLYRLLGPFEVWTGDSWQAVRGAKARSLLAVLLINANQNVPVERLIAELWPADPPRSAGTLVRGYVLGLRRVIGDAAGAVLTTQVRGYRLSSDRAELDANRFEDLLAEGRAALAADEPATASRVLAGALQLWRGAPLADVPLTPAATAHADRLAERRLDALEVWAEAQLAQAGPVPPDGLIGRLRELVALHPFRERFAAQLMRALQAAGRRAEALEAYAGTRRHLVEELGVDPGPELVRVHQQVLTAGPGPAPAPAPAPPGPVPVQTPPDIADFTGRDKATHECLAVLTGPAPAALPVLVLSGPGGVGKSALAIHLAHRLAPAYPDGQLYADLAPGPGRVVEPGHVLGQFLRALGVPAAAVPAGTADRAALYRSRLRDRRVLVVLDNATGETQVRALRPGSATCAVLITSRSRLAGLEGTSVVELAAFEPAESLELFRRIAGAEPAEREPGPAAAIVRLCGHLPLAVRVAAARAGRRPLSRLAEALGDDRRRLDQLRIGDLGVRASIAAGYRTLAERPRRLFRRLGLLDGAGFTERTAEAVAGLAGPDFEAALEALVDARLVDAIGQSRYRLPDLVRLFARERAAAEEPWWQAGSIAPPAVSSTL